MLKYSKCVFFRKGTKNDTMKKNIEKTRSGNKPARILALILSALLISLSLQLPAGAAEAAPGEENLAVWEDAEAGDAAETTGEDDLTENVPEAGDDTLAGNVPAAGDDAPAETVPAAAENDPAEAEGVPAEDATEEAVPAETEDALAEKITVSDNSESIEEIITVEIPADEPEIMTDELEIPAEDALVIPTEEEPAIPAEVSEGAGTEGASTESTGTEPQPEDPATAPAEVQEVLAEIIEETITIEEEIAEPVTEEQLDSQLDTDKTLAPGATGADVKTMQYWLAQLGYLSTYAVDGDYGTVTQRAVKKFQIYNGLKATGTADAATLTKLGSSPTAFYGLSQGEYSIPVYGMQVVLYELGYLDFTPDGDYGPRTAGCVRLFQKVNGLYEDGEAGAITIEVLAGTPASYTPSTGEISLGAVGQDVVDIQKTLISLGYLVSVADGEFGRVTRAAVIAFQAANGISSPDGSVGPYTRELMKKASKYSPLKKGSAGNSVQLLQAQLANLGYPVAVADGDYGNLTELAVKLYQLYNGLEVTGIADVGTLNSLYYPGNAFYSLKAGSTGTAVRGLQKGLYDLGYLDLAPDGDYGSYTAASVRAFQKANNLYIDGEAGFYTLGVLLTSPITYDTYREENAAVQYGGTYIITTALGSSVIEVANSSVYTGANVQLNSNSGYGCQKWVLQNAGDGYYYLRNLRSWKVLTLYEGNVCQSENVGDPSQKWKITSAGGGGFYIINSNGMYLDPDGASAAALTNVAASASDGSKGQVWYFTETESGTALDFRVDGTQYLGIRTFSINQGNVTETSGYYHIQTDIKLASGGYYLSGGDNYSIGLKVMYVNSYLAEAGYLGWDYYGYNRYDGNTVWAVRQFQSDHGLEVDGVTGLQDWLAMGYSEYDWYNLGSYVTGLKVYAYGSSRETYINAMLNTAYEYAAAGTGFADGASGEPGTYVDCSGLIFQCLYAAGINPDLSIIDHARVVYEYTSRYLGNDWQMGTAVSNAQPGDLIFYGNSSINHVAIYAGNGMIYDSWPGIGVSYRSMYSGGNILKIVRVF